MTLPEHAACSLLLTQFGVRERLGTRGVVLVIMAGLAPDIDSAAKLVADSHFWELHHALGHSLISIFVLSLGVAAVGRLTLGIRCFGLLFGWCLVAAFAHCLTDALYWWGVQPFWPFSRFEVCFNILEYLDVFVLTLWLAAAFCALKLRNPRRVALVALTLFACYVALRAVLPPPTGFLRLMTGGWMYEAPQGTSVLDWW
jgi:membrane-bound metal-dependent hydrolase YbcI (DUF457 family)